MGGPDPSQFGTIVATALGSYWPLVLVNLGYRWRHFPAARSPTTSQDAFIGPYVNVIRMHLLIFVFAGKSRGDDPAVPAGVRFGLTALKAIGDGEDRCLPSLQCQPSHVDPIMTRFPHFPAEKRGLASCRGGTQGL